MRKVVYIYIYLFKATAAPPRAGTTGIYIYIKTYQNHMIWQVALWSSTPAAPAPAPRLRLAPDSPCRWSRCAPCRDLEDPKMAQKKGKNPPTSPEFLRKIDENHQKNRWKIRKNRKHGEKWENQWRKENNKNRDLIENSWNWSNYSTNGFN